MVNYYYKKRKKISKTVISNLRNKFKHYLYNQINNITKLNN